MSSLWTTVVCPDGPYEMNTEGIARLIRSYAYARALKENSTVNVEKHLLGPNLVTVDIDWTQVPKSRDHFIAQTSNEFFMRMSTNMSGSQGMDYLETMVEDRDGYHAQVLDMQRDAGKQTMANIETSVERGDVAIKALTAVRDGAAETELVLASVALAPAAAGVIGGGLVSGRHHHCHDVRDLSVRGPRIDPVAGSPGDRRAGAPRAGGQRLADFLADHAAQRQVGIALRHYPLQRPGDGRVRRASSVVTGQRRDQYDALGSGHLVQRFRMLLGGLRHRFAAGHARPGDAGGEDVHRMARGKTIGSSTERRKP